MTGLTIADPAFLGAAAGFSPLSLSPALWYDAADTSTIIQSAGKVSQWNDKSGNGRNAVQATSAAQPTTGSTTQNGRNVLAFDGNDCLSYVATLDTTNAYTIAIVATPSTGTDDYLFMLHRTTATIAQSAIITKYLSRSYESFNDASGAGTARFTLGSPSLTGYNTLIVIRNGTALTSSVNGSSSNSGTWNALNFVWTAVHIGAAGTAAFSTANIAEIVVIPSAISGANLTTLSDYLRTKWATP